MKSFNVICWGFNTSKPEPYDVIPYLVECYNKTKLKPETFAEFAKFVKRESMYKWWGRCEYEIIIHGWPKENKESKWDIYQQILMNIKTVTEILIEAVNKEAKNK